MLPNILWIITTQWRGQALGCAGDVNARTPSLDALARSGTLFTQAVTPHPFGPFARAAMLTGVESPENGVRDYFDVLPPGARTIAHDMADRSYSTSFFGKWHLSARDKAAPLTGEDHARQIVPLANQGGFGFWEGFESGFQINNPWLHGTRLPVPVRFDGYQSDVVCERAGAYLAGVSGPWFSVVSLESPHPPYSAPASGIAAADPSMVALRINVPSSEPIEERARREIAGYYAHIEATDRAIGRLVASLPADTVVVFSSAHGDMHGSHGLFRKGWPYEESIRVPLIVRSMASPGVDSRAVSLIDLPAMTMGCADGKAKVPLRSERTGGYVRISMPSVVDLPDQCDRVWACQRSISRKFVTGPDGGHWLHFDLENDPFEMRNLDADPKSGAPRGGTRHGF